MSSPSILCLGASLMLASVAAGAFGAHALRGSVPAELLAVFQTAVQYQAWHALGLLAVGVLRAQWPHERGLVAVATAFLAGIVLFSGSLYVYVLSGVRAFAMVTPLGGVAFLVGWAVFAVTAYRRVGPRPPAG